MIKVTDSAVKQLNKIGDDNSIFKIITSGYGWGGPRLGLVKTENTQNDEVHNIEGLSFIVDKSVADLTSYYGKLIVDFVSVMFMKDFVVQFEGASSC